MEQEIVGISHIESGLGGIKERVEALGRLL